MLEPNDKIFEFYQQKIVVTLTSTIFVQIFQLPKKSKSWICFHHLWGEKKDPWGSTPTAAKASPTLPAMLAPSPARAMAAMAPEPKVPVIFGRKNWAFLKGWIVGMMGGG